METDGEINKMETNDESSDFGSQMITLSSETTSSYNLSSSDASSPSSENITHTCKCAVFVQQPNLADNVFYPCSAHDMRYGVTYPCSQRGQVVLAYGTAEKIYCEMHAAMFRDHRQCQYCYAFCYQGNFVVCAEGSCYHWMDGACAEIMGQQCAHCDSLGPHIEQWNFHPEHSSIFNKLASMVFEYNTGKQLNSLLLCDEECELWLLKILDSVLFEDAESTAFNGLCDSIANGDRRALLRTILFTAFPESDESIDEIHKAINEAIRRDDNLSLLIILQFVDIRPNFENLSLAVDRGNVRGVNVLLHHGAPLRSDSGEIQTKHLLNRSLDLRKLDVAEEILKFTGRNEEYVGGANDTLVRDAIEADDVDRLQLVMQYGANICAKDKRNETVLHRLARSKSENALQMTKLICTSAYLTQFLMDATNVCGETAVGIACEVNNWDIAKLFLEYGASPEGIPIDMKTPPSLNSLIERFRNQLKLKKLIPDPRRYVARDLTMGRERHPIVVENGVGDGAVLDTDFEYASMVIDLDVFRCKIDFSLACRCVNNCQVDCPCVSRCAYDSTGRLSDKARELAERKELGIILECNSSCFCSRQCQSRVAQNGVRANLEVYRSTRYGWAVRSTVPIQRGEFICEYTGELISGEEADRREDDTYLFEIIDDDASYCIDAKRRGNVSRFVNHSCDANLMIIKVVWDANIRHFPHICFFAKRNISRGEELTIDYGKQWWDVKLRKFACQCGNKKCMYGDEARAKLLQDSVATEP